MAQFLLRGPFPKPGKVCVIGNCSRGNVIKISAQPQSRSPGEADGLGPAVCLFHAGDKNIAVFSTKQCLFPKIKVAACIPEDILVAKDHFCCAMLLAQLCNGDHLRSHGIFHRFICLLHFCKDKGSGHCRCRFKDSFDGAQLNVERITAVTGPHRKRLFAFFPLGSDFNNSFGSVIVFASGFAFLVPRRLEGFTIKVFRENIELYERCIFIVVFVQVQFSNIIGRPASDERCFFGRTLIRRSLEVLDLFSQHRHVLFDLRQSSHRFQVLKGRCRMGMVKTQRIDAVAS